MIKIDSAVRRGAGYALAVISVELGMTVRFIIAQGLPATPWPMATAALIQVALGGVLGFLLSPVGRFERGALWHFVGVVAVWVGLARTVAPDPNALPMWLGAPLIGAVLCALGIWASRCLTYLPTLVGVALPALIIGYHSMHAASPRSTHMPPLVDGQDVQPAGAPSPDVVLVVLDTVRAQSMSTYGYARNTSPVFTQMASQGVLFEDTTSPSTWSLPSHGSLFTGRFPSSHAVHAEHRYLEDETPTLAQVFARAGYDTRCFTANPHISDGFGLTRGFAWSDRAWAAGRGARGFVFIFRVLDLFGWSVDDKGGARVASNFEAWMEDRKDDPRPSFAFVNFLEAHFPYHQLPADYLGRYTDESSFELRAHSLRVMGAQFGRKLTESEAQRSAEPSTAMYDAGVAYTDHLLGRLIEALKRSGRYDRTILAVVSDHGELVGEYGIYGHGTSMHEADLRVPMAIRYPPSIPGGARIGSPVSMAAIYPTLLGLAGLDGAEHAQASDLMPLLQGKTGGEPVIVERFARDRPETSDDALARMGLRYRIYRKGNWKLAKRSDGQTFLFDLAADQGETRDLAHDNNAQLAAMEAELATWVDTMQLPPLDAPIATYRGANPNDEAVEHLKSLGYVD